MQSEMRVLVHAGEFVTSSVIEYVRLIVCLAEPTSWFFCCDRKIAEKPIFVENDGTLSVRGAAFMAVLLQAH
jgi:hypothetical protein